MLDERLPLILLYATRVNRKFLRRPASVVFSMVQPLAWLVLIGWVLDRSGFEVSGVRYLSFFLPTAVALTLGYASFQGGIGTALEIEGGFARRLCHLGASPLQVLLGRWISDTSKAITQVFILLVVGDLLGASVIWQPYHLGVTLLVVLSFLIMGLAISNALAVGSGNSETTFALATVAIPITLLVSGAFVDRSDLPQPIRGLSYINPVSYALSALRGALGGDLEGPATVAGILLVVGTALLVLVSRSPALTLQPKK